MLVRLVEQREIQLDFLMWHASNNPRKQEVSEIRDNRMGANLTVPIPMSDFSKFKILECSIIGQQMNWIEPCVPTTFEFLFLYVIGVNEFKTMVLKWLYDLA